MSRAELQEHRRGVGWVGVWVGVWVGLGRGGRGGGSETAIHYRLLSRLERRRDVTQHKAVPSHTHMHARTPAHTHTHTHPPTPTHTHSSSGLITILSPQAKVQFTGSGN